MTDFHDIDLQDCPMCQGPGILEDENGWYIYVMCMDCGCHTAEISYSTPAERLEAAEKAAHLWNIGKAISSAPGE